MEKSDTTQASPTQTQENYFNHSANQKHHRVLIVDDTEENINYLERVLSRVGITTSSAMSGLEAINRVSANDSFDLIFMDIQMPVMDGIAALEALRKKGISIPIIAMTASNIDQLKKRLGDFKFDGFLAKPSLVQDILTAMKSHFPEIGDKFGVSS